MITIKKNQLNQFAVTLNELKSKNLPNNWLWLFEPESDNEQMSNERIVTQLNEIESSKRYNEFELNEGVDVTFKRNGYYAYKVYQVPYGVTEITEESHIVESGRLRVFGEQVESREYKSENKVFVYGQ